ncbi:MAG: hypothetical protein DMD34_07830 [Gemmatimonadetes bacterium]|nr:MAG: hypothetical protein DMD34_07830 [Gemmatimonadota bacterium]
MHAALLIGRIPQPQRYAADEQRRMAGYHTYRGWAANTAAIPTRANATPTRISAVTEFSTN